MRAADRPIPPLTLDPVPAIATWPIRPVLAISGARSVAEYDAGLVYDAGDNPVTTARVGTARVGYAQVGQG